MYAHVVSLRASDDDGPRHGFVLRAGRSGGIEQDLQRETRIESAAAEIGWIEVLACGIGRGVGEDEGGTGRRERFRDPQEMIFAMGDHARLEERDGIERQADVRVSMLAQKDGGGERIVQDVAAVRLDEQADPKTNQVGPQGEEVIGEPGRSARHPVTRHGRAEVVAKRTGVDQQGRAGESFQRPPIELQRVAAPYTGERGGAAGARTEGDDESLVVRRARLFNVEHEGKE